MEKTNLNDRRLAARGRMIQSGTLAHEADKLKCVLLDISDTGARVHLLAKTTAPDMVYLELPGGVIRIARRRWQDGENAGFEFIENGEFQ